MTVQFDAPSWSQIYEMLLDLADKIKESGFKPDIIVAVSRGGWLPARVLSDILDNPNLASVRVEFYQGIAEPRTEPNLTQKVSTEVADRKILIVDEVTDSGRSLKLVKEHLYDEDAKEVRVATIYRKPWSATRPDYCVKETRKWIVFPWELKESLRKKVNEWIDGGKQIEKESRKLVEAGIPQRLVERFLRETLEEEKCR